MTSKIKNIGALNGSHIEKLILGKCSNPSNFIDDIENKIEIKSCIEKIKAGNTTRNGSFRIHIEQHKYLLEISGYYLFVVQDKNFGTPIFIKKIPAKIIEIKFNYTTRPYPKKGYFSLNWKKAILPFVIWE